MKSKKILFQDLAALGIPEFADAVEKKLNHRRIGNETFGRKSMLFVHFADHAQRRQAERALEAKGHRIHADYHPGSGTAEIQVSYFKGWHWDE